MNVSDIRKIVTHFSEQLRMEPKNQEHVIVGGKIIKIIPPVLDNHMFYTLILDDHVGTLHVCIPFELYQAYPESFCLDRYVFLEGYVNVMTRRMDGQVAKDVSVYAFDLKQLEGMGV